MKLTAKIKLLPTKSQAEALKRTLETANSACNYISQVAWDNRTFSRNPLHQLVYYDVRELFGLSAQATVRCIAKVVDAYKVDRKTPRTFKETGGIAYDNRLLSYHLKDSCVSIWTVAGRFKVSFVAGDHQSKLLQTQHGESDLLLIGGDFYLAATCETTAAAAIQPMGVLGVDLGVVNIATDSDGEVFSGRHINNVRHRHRRLRKKLQQKGTKSAKRRLKRLSGKEKRFAKDTNHVISKRLVAKAQGTSRAIAVETLKGIRERITVRKPQRATLHSWAFNQLQQFVLYKAELAGVPVLEVDPENTSRTCPECGCVDKRNRQSQEQFTCMACGFAGLADHIAACNIASRAVVNLPNVSDTPHCRFEGLTPNAAGVAPGTSPRLLVEGC